MTVPYRQEIDPVGRGWEVALVVPLVGAVAIVLAALVGQGLSAAVFGGGWVWPDGGGDAVVRAFVGLLANEPGRGLPSADAHRLPGRLAVYSGVLVTEVILVGVAGGLLLLWLRYRHPVDARGGLASRAEAAAVLGIGRLRAASAVVRPDLTTGRER